MFRRGTSEELEAYLVLAAGTQHCCPSQFLLKFSPVITRLKEVNLSSFKHVVIDRSSKCK